MGGRVLVDFGGPVNDSDDAPPMFEVVEVDLSHLRPCPPLPGPWPERHPIRCDLCPGDDRATLELFVDLRGAEMDSDARQLCVAQAAAAHRWLLLVDGTRICRACATGPALDYGDPVVLSAVKCRRIWLRIVRSIGTWGVRQQWERMVAGETP